MAGTGTYMDQILPENIWDALLGANSPSGSNVFATMADLPAPSITLYSSDGTIGPNRVATITDKLAFSATVGTQSIAFGIGQDPLSFGFDGIQNYLYLTPSSNIYGWGGLLNIAGEPAWFHEVFTELTQDTSGFFAGWSVAQSNSYSSLYHLEAGPNKYTGFEANAFGEQLYSQRVALVTTALTVNDRVLFVSAAGGYIKATTYADLVTQLAIPTFYNSDGSTVGARTVTLGGTLQFNHGAAGVNGYLQIATGGYFINQTATAGNYFEYNHNDGTFSANSVTHTRTGFKATRSGDFLEMMSGGGKGYFNTNAYMEFYTGNTANYGGMLDSTGKWRFGSPTGGVAKVTINGAGNTEATANTIWNNVSTLELARITDNGGLCIGINTLTGGFANASKLRIGDIVSADYTSSLLIDQTYAQTANNTNTSSAIFARLYKSSAFNTLEMKASNFLARNDGAGSINLMYGNESMIWGIGAATIQSAFAYSARIQFQAGTYTLIGGLDVSYQESLAGNVGSMVGVLVRTPVNVTAPVVNNTYGIYLQANNVGTNNYGIVSNAQSSNGFGTDTPNAKAILQLVSTTKGFMPPNMTQAQRDEIAAPPASLLLYNTDTNKINFYNGAAWEQVTSA